ncbi:kinase-like protein [Dothidotthia symphoricarpi CBS 119687]|uniref:non-specific serine/threonine protein kinase n=1 Tax=Dothidotthia symphoricarpi CBS 119687 TaxID=1392245 RepID=A0A6A6ABN6_9PLEO|nr:kinase-like protein [Dothidotthia symphoricarpi CBS 119687]KAF2128424.1 kinase-like protein [Dothidotthia symphoricarpi CBS 119687]
MKARPEHYGWANEHLIIGPHDEDILVACRALGHGSLGVVEEVQAEATLNIIQEEARNLKSLVHPHIVTFIGDNDLADFLDIVSEQDSMLELRTQWRQWIRSWIVCLASALEYMHQNGIQHQDIKPSNIIHRGDRVLFTDFSSSRAFEVGHTTSTDNPSRSSPMYAAPEVTAARFSGKLGRHGRGSDIFALGCVFCDMLTVLQGRSVSSLKEYLLNENSAVASNPSNVKGPLYYGQKLPLIHEWFSGSSEFLSCISLMLESDRTLRPDATKVVETLTSDDYFEAGCTCCGSTTSLRNS